MEGESKPMEFDKIAAALSKAQAKMTNPPKTKTAKVYRSKDKGGGFSHSYQYADLADVLDHVRGPLTENGLAIIQIVTPGMLITRLVHESGQSFESNYPLPQTAIDPQSMGSAITYARRYSICPLLGIAGETDDDAKEATDAEQAMTEAEETQKKEEARKRIEEMKAKGQMKSAYTGKTLKPGEEALPEPTPEAKPEETTTAKAVDPLTAAMEKAGITPDQLKTFAVKAGHLPAPGISPDKFPADYVEKLLKNWAKVVAHIKKGDGK